LDEIGLVVYEEMSFEVKVYGRTTDGRRTKSDHKSSPCHFVAGELKTIKSVFDKPKRLTSFQLETEYTIAEYK
jgi:hypothetical protein